MQPVTIPSLTGSVNTAMETKSLYTNKEDKTQNKSSNRFSITTEH